MPTTEANTLKSLIEVLTQIQTEMLDQDRTASAFVEQLSPDFRASTRNLLHYVALRRYDLRLLQEQLIGMGLSSLGRAESAVLANLQAVLRLLHRLAESIPAPTEPPAITHAEGRKLLRNHTHELLGPAPLGRQVRIMVTVPGEAADHGQLIRHLLHDGMDCTAHQLCPRRCCGVGKNDRAPAPSGKGTGRILPGADGFIGSETANGSNASRTQGRQMPAQTR